jgi:hypothetical protein
MEANARPGADIVIFAMDGTLRLTIAGANEDNARTGDLDITESLTIRGNSVGNTIVDGGATAVKDRVFHIDPAGAGLELPSHGSARGQEADRGKL